MCGGTAINTLRKIKPTLFVIVMATIVGTTSAAIIVNDITRNEISLNGTKPVVPTISEGQFEREHPLNHMMNGASMQSAGMYKHDDDASSRSLANAAESQLILKSDMNVLNIWNGAWKKRSCPAASNSANLDQRERGLFSCSLSSFLSRYGIGCANSSWMDAC
jgi:hypothetical protein